jgi:hypothetical protein
MNARPLLSGLAVVLLLAAEDRPTLKEFTPKEGSFSVKLPGKPKEKVEDVQAPSGKVEVLRTYVCVPDLKTTYFIFDQGMQNLAGADDKTLNKVLEDGRKEAEKSLNGKPLNEKKVALGKYPGLEYRIESAKVGGVYRCRTYIVDGRMYQLTISGAKDVVTSKTADEYLESFKLLKKEK